MRFFCFQCKEAIENCIGVRAGRPLRDYFKIIRRLAWKKAFEAQKPYEPKSKYKKKKKKKKKTEDDTKSKRTTQEPVAPKIKLKKKSVKSMSVLGTLEDQQQQQHHEHAEEKGEEAAAGSSTSVPHEELEIRSSLYTHDTAEDYIPPGKSFPYRPLQRYTTNIKNYMAEKYLDSLYLDKIFLENLSKTPGVTNPNAKASKKILHMCKSGFKALSYKQVSISAVHGGPPFSPVFASRNCCAQEDPSTSSSIKRRPRPEL